MYNKKKLIIYTAYPYWPRLETELEIADKHINTGYNVTFIACMGGLVICPNNLKHRKLKCLSCTSRFYAGYKWLGKDRAALKRMYNLSSEQQIVIDKMISQPLNCWNDLRAIQIEGDDVGEAAFSGFVTHLRETHPDFNNQNVDFVKLLLKNALIVHFSIQNHLLEEKPDKIILFNGRTPAYRPALRVGVSLGIDTKVFEVGSRFNTYMLTNKIYSHDPINFSKKILQAYERSILKKEDMVKIAYEWYHGREEATASDQLLFTQKQIKEFGRSDLKKESKLKVGIFVSSEDELFAIAESKSLFYKDQNMALAQITEDLKDEDILFIVRAHPNLMGLNNTQTKGLLEICSSRNNIKYISPESKISTYELVDTCNVVIVFGSTVGIEAVYKGKPTILMGQAVYRGFGGTIEPDSHEELIKILKESVELGNVPEQYVPSDEAMQRAATIYVIGFQESEFQQQYQKLKNYYKIHWIEKDGVRTYIRPHIVYRVFELIYRIAGMPGRILKRIYRKFRLF